MLSYIDLLPIYDANYFVLLLAFGPEGHHLGAQSCARLGEREGTTDLFQMAQQPLFVKLEHGRQCVWVQDDWHSLGIDVQQLQFAIVRGPVDGLDRLTEITMFA